ncbi:MAG: DUF1643 domain-containing protein [Acidobacteria bacterium]|nr:DUF1643 domain-containing protein [Acidobacteriota bacterium]
MIERTHRIATLLETVISFALYSACEIYRYKLTRRWSDGPTLAFLMLNPSTATEAISDPTVARCEERARRGGYGGLAVINLFALRSTDPKVLYTHPDPVGEHNDNAIVEVAKESEKLICAWGAHGKLLGRAETIQKILRDAGIPLYALKLNKGKFPAHPLYLPYSLEPFKLG